MSACRPADSGWCRAGRTAGRCVTAPASDRRATRQGCQGRQGEGRPALDRISGSSGRGPGRRIEGSDRHGCGRPASPWRPISSVRHLCTTWSRSPAIRSRCLPRPRSRSPASVTEVTFFKGDARQARRRGGDPPGGRVQGSRRAAHPHDHEPAAQDAVRELHRRPLRTARRTDRQPSGNSRPRRSAD
jgi:hypothetical protein